MFNLFNERPLNEYLTEKKEKIYEFIENETESKIEVNTHYLNSIYKNEYINVPHFKFDEIYVEAKEKKINGSPKTVFIFKIPFIGDKELLKLEPDTHIFWTIPVDIETRENGHILCFEIIDNDDDIKVIEDKFKINIKNIRIHLENFSAELEAYNNHLPILIKNKLEDRKNRILKRNEKLKALQKLLTITKY